MWRTFSKKIKKKLIVFVRAAERDILPVCLCVFHKHNVIQNDLYFSFFQLFTSNKFWKYNVCTIITSRVIFFTLHHLVPWALLIHLVIMFYLEVALKDQPLL